MNIHKLTLAALLVAIGTLSAHLIYIPAGASKCFPVQHAINVLCAVILGPKEAVSVAFVISCLRNMFGTGRHRFASGISRQHDWRLFSRACLPPLA